jgi:hemerythrin
MGFIWRDSYSIGNASIDAEHQQLFKLADAFFNADDHEKKTDCAIRLFKYTREHFEHEEQLMRDMGYPEFLAHAQQHTQLISRLNEVSEKIANDTLSAAELKTFLTAWLVGHIVTFDTRLSVYARQADTNKV